MNLFKTSVCEPFLNIVANFILSNFGANLDKVKIIVPTGFDANNLQKLLIQEKKALILPEIVAYHNITTSGEEFFNIPFHSIDFLTSLEEKIFLAQIINNYSELNYNYLQSLKFAPLLAQLFHELNYNNINIIDIENLPTIHQALHWGLIYDFLKYAHKNLEAKALSLNKVSKSTYLKIMLESEITKLLNDPNYIVIAIGFIEFNNSCSNFLKALSSLNNGYIILPPLPSTIAKGGFGGHYLTNLYLNNINKNIEDFKPLLSAKQSQFSSKLDNIMLEAKDNNIQVFHGYKLDVQYIECADIFSEADIISLICNQHAGCTIAIITSTNQTAEYYQNFLYQYELSFINLFGENLLTTPLCQLILYLSDLLCSDFELTKLLILLKNPLLFNKNVSKFEKLFSNNNRFTQDLNNIKDIIYDHKDEELISFWNNFLTILHNAQNNEFFKKNRDFNEILKFIISILEKIIPGVWISRISYANEICQLFTEIIAINYTSHLTNLSDFILILKGLINGARIIDHNLSHKGQILICRAEEAINLELDLVILADFNEGSWPPDEIINPWLNRQMEEELSFNHHKIRNATYLYNFYLLLHKPKIYITRAKKIGSKLLLPSNYINKLQFIIPDITINYHELLKNINKSHPASNYITNPSHPNNQNNFPTKLSITDIELLIKSPYSFYIKKILRLSKTDYCNVHPKLSEYGNFLHNLINLYTIDYSNYQNNLQEYFLTLSKNLLDLLILPKYIKNSWYTKSAALVNEFIVFDEERRANIVKIYSELKGSITLNILQKQIKIVGIADRIEIDKNGVMTILDYKTGTIPSKKNVEQGMSPQLIILGLIALENGFGINIIPTAIELIYVKIASSSPYIQITDLQFNELRSSAKSRKLSSLEKLVIHKEALIKLLTYYVENQNYPDNINFLDYNDYQHFMRSFK